MTRIPKELSTFFGPHDETRWSRDGEKRFHLQTNLLNWSIESIPPLAVTPAFTGEMYEAFPDVHVSGGAGLRSRLFAVTPERALCLDEASDLRCFLERYASREDPVELAQLVELCQGSGRLANVYVANGGLERNLTEEARAVIEELGLAAPILTGDKLTFYSWRILMEGPAEAIELEFWTVSLSGPDGPRWHFTRLPTRPRFGR